MPRATKNSAARGNPARKAKKVTHSAKSLKSVKARVAKKPTKAAGASRAEGIRLFALAGRPSKENFIKVYGPDGPKMTWELLNLDPGRLNAYNRKLLRSGGMLRIQILRASS